MSQGLKKEKKRSIRLKGSSEDDRDSYFDQKIPDKLLDRPMLGENESRLEPIMGVKTCWPKQREAKPQNGYRLSQAKAPGQKKVAKASLAHRIRHPCEP
jgi:hypothetical protein